MSAPILETRGLRKSFPIERGISRRARKDLVAVDGVDLTVAAGTTTGLVGESGSGKSTVARLVLRLVEPTAGEVLFDGDDITARRGRALRAARRHMQMVFQDPYSSFDPTAAVGSSIAEPLRTHLGLDASTRRTRVRELLELVGLPPEHAHRRPRELSGGQLQRCAVARALAVEPRLVVLDEPVSSLDVSTQAQIINLLADLKRRLGIAYLLIAHDLSVVRHVSDRIAVMYLGRIVEEGAASVVAASPKHPYTDALLSAVPVPDPARRRQRERIVLRGELPSGSEIPSGCRFHSRCPHVMPVCVEIDPAAFVTADGSTVFCHLHTDGPKLAGASVQDVGVSV